MSQLHGLSCSYRTVCHYRRSTDSVVVIQHCPHVAQQQVELQMTSGILLCSGDSVAERISVHDFAGLCLTVLWLTFTALPRTRARAFGGRASCTNFTSDMASDIIFTVLWFVVVTLDSVSLAVRLYKDSRMQAALFLSVAVFCMHVATAVLSGQVRKQLRSATTAATATGRLRGVLNGVSLQKLEEGAAAKSGPVSGGRASVANCRAML
jgi:hypothetical protein